MGLKGQLSELELHTIRTRLTAGLLNKAQRGDLALSLPIGFIRDDQGTVLKDPHQEVQQKITMIFENFLKLKSASRVVRYFNDHQLRIPRRNRYKDLVWKKPTVAAILSTLKNPAYAGAFVYGKSRALRQGTSLNRTSQKQLPLEQWKIIVKNKYPAYISWELYEKIRAMLKDNYAEYDRNKSRGVPREGEALLHGITYCGECGHKMVVQYKTTTRYICNYLRQQHQVPVCQYIPANPVDAKVVEAFFEALSPVELDVYQQALDKQQEQQADLEKSQAQQLKRLRYQVDLAQRQYDQVDPSNRLVAAELEKRWEAALQEFRQAETLYEKQTSPVASLTIPSELKEALQTIGQNLPKLWETPTIPTRQKKSILRCLIDKVILHRSARDQIQTRIVWKGGATSTFQVPVSVGSFNDLSQAEEMKQKVVELFAQGDSDEEIAEKLTLQGFRSPMKDFVLVSTVRNIRYKNQVVRVAHQSHPLKIAGFLSVSQVARKIEVPTYWVYDRIHNGTIKIKKDTQRNAYLFPDTGETIQQFQKLKKGSIQKLTF